MPELQANTPLYTPDLFCFTRNDVTYAVDSEAPNWVAVDDRGVELLDDLRAAVVASTPLTLANLVASYASRRQLEAGKAWVHVHDFVTALVRAGIVAAEPFARPAYQGRAALIQPIGLRELWLQVNNACNLTCTHCLVSSGPSESSGLDPQRLVSLVEEAVPLGLERVFVTGGEPFLRKDLFSLAQRITGTHGLDLVILTNATVLSGAVLDGLRSLDRERVKLQVSLDGARPSSNDPVRGAGTFARVLDGAKLLADLGFEVSLTTVTTDGNLAELKELPAIARQVGARSQHLMWSHRRGRASASDSGFFPAVTELLSAVDDVIAAAARAGIEFDNLEAVKRRVNGVPGIKYDLGNAGWDSICVYADGIVYPSAALANEPTLRCGDTGQTALADILVKSDIIQELRHASLIRCESLRTDPLRFITGGGDIEHAWCFTGDFLGTDPYYPITAELTRRVMSELGDEKIARRNQRSGYDAPLVLHAMGDGAIACGTADGVLAEQPVLTLHSNCVLSFDVDKPRARVREFYGEAAETPQAALCCPTQYDSSAIDHIPQDVIDRFYGCGSPMTMAGVTAGEVVLDLGAGAGIDVFIAAKLVGSEGRAIGVDMTQRMLEIARENQPKVAERLGYDVIDLREGFLEKIPVDSKSVDLVTSNCVINLSPDKPRVFEEIWRVLRDHGRIVISDIVSERRVPPSLKTNPQLWGECLVGALTQDELLAELERAGFYGIEILGKSYWKDVEDYPFFSVTVRGYKFEKTAGCVFKGHRAVYLGPAKAFVDEEGHLFPRNEPYEVCTDTVAKLSHAPYLGHFAILAPGEERVGYACCAPGQTCC